ncbi:hypothetical protein IC582_026874 [Cucumis melo]
MRFVSDLRKKMSLPLGSLQLLSNPNTNLHNMKIFHINHIFVADNKIVPSHPASYYVAAAGGGGEGQSGISNVSSYSLIPIFDLSDHPCWWLTLHFE